VTRELEIQGSEYGPLFFVKWFRVVLDEASHIRNHRINRARACLKLVSQLRWCLTGTPIENTIQDLFSLIAFLRIE
jgi:SNF2 family DNA or RNA helicase